MTFQVRMTPNATAGGCGVGICYEKATQAFAIAPSIAGIGLNSDYVWFCDYHSRYLAKTLGYEIEPEVYTVGCGRG